MHAVNNTGLNILSAFYDKDKIHGIWAQPTLRMLIQIIPIIILGIFVIVVMCREDKTEI